MDYTLQRCFWPLPNFPSTFVRLQGCWQTLIAAPSSTHLAAHPAAGDLIEGTGGVRKLRWARDGRGKSGGVRVIYYFHSEAMPLYLLTMVAKNERANLSKAERNALAGLVDVLAQVWLERQGDGQGIRQHQAGPD